MICPSRPDYLAASAAMRTPVARPTPSWDRPVALGSARLRVSRLGFGRESVREGGMLGRAAGLGITHFHWFRPAPDVCNLEVIAQPLKAIRKRIVLACGSNHRTKRQLTEEIELQLRALGTDRSSCGISPLATYLSTYPMNASRLSRCEKRGQVRAFGVTTPNLKAVFPRLLQLRDHICAVMDTCNFAIWAGATENPRPDAAPPSACAKRSAGFTRRASASSV